VGHVKIGEEFASILSADYSARVAPAPLSRKGADGVGHASPTSLEGDAQTAKRRCT